MRTDVSGALKTDMHILAAVAFLALAFSTGPLSAFDISDLRQLRDSSYRSCPKCDLSGGQLQGANLRRAQLQGANLAHAVLEDADLSFAVLEGAVIRGGALGRQPEYCAALKRQSARRGATKRRPKLR